MYKYVSTFYYNLRKGHNICKYEHLKTSQARDIGINQNYNFVFWFYNLFILLLSISNAVC